MVRRGSGLSWFVLATVAPMVLAGCSSLVTAPVPVASSPPAGPSPSVASPSSSRTPSTKAATRNDLKTGRTSRSVDAGGVRLTVEYSLRTKVSKWRPGKSQPLTVALTALNDDNPEEKIYLSGVTVYVGISDERGEIDSPSPLTDRANITPGYLVTSPATYTQVFVLPPLPGDANRLTVDIRYEMLRLQKGKSRDYAKLSTTSTIVMTKP